MISGTFADVLAAGRSGFNQHTREAQGRYPAFRPDVFGQFLEDGVGSVVDAVAEVEPARVPKVVLAAYDMALELVGRAQVGRMARSQALADAWRDLFPQFAGLIAAEPATVLGMLSNAIIYMGAIPGLRTGQWADELRTLAPHITTLDQLRIVGQVVAWRAGAAHFRDGAIAAAEGLPEALALAAFGCASAITWQELRSRIQRDPWWVAGDNYAVRELEIGSFRGFGGSFTAPPEVRSAGGGFIVRSGERHFVLIADAYGAVLRPASAEEFEQAEDHMATLDYSVHGEELVVGMQHVMLDVPESGLSVCATDTTIAITSPYTHAIRLLPREVGR